MDLSIGPISALYPSRLVQRFTSDLRLERPPQAEPPARNGDPTGPAGVGITLSPQAMLALQGLHPPAAARTEASEAAARSEPSPQEGVASQDHQVNRHVDVDQGSAPGADASRADLIGARTAYRMAASVADAGRSGITPGVDLAA